MNRKAKKSAGGSGLGRSLIKDRNKSNRRRKDDGTGWLHTSELDDGYEWGRLNLQSVTEQSRLDEFLSTAELAGIEFKAEKLNIKVVDVGTYTGLPSELERKESRKAEEENLQYLSIPRRPKWNSSTSPEQLDLLEKESFLEWRRSLNHLQEDDRLTLTPFEKNLEFWRQLWRVVEKSDILVQIVDARNPLLFRCEDLEKYVLEISPHKVNMILISKADLLTPKQRATWRKHFQENTSIVIAFWSALLESEEEATEGERSDDGEGSCVEMEAEGVESAELTGEIPEGNSAANVSVATPLDLATPLDVVPFSDTTTPSRIGASSDVTTTPDDTTPPFTPSDVPVTPSDVVTPSAPPSDITTPSAPPSDVTTPSSPPSDVTTPSSPPSDVTTPSAPPSDVTTPPAPPSDVTTPSAPPSDVTTPSSPPSDVTTPSAPPSDVTIPPTTPSNVAMPPSDVAMPPATPSDITTPSDVTTPSSPPSDVPSDVAIPATVGTTPTDQVEDTASKILSRDELVSLFREISPVPAGSLTTVGMVGYPNVGKSSTINALFQGKKVPVSATPGRTKHFQTLYLHPDLMLCDCPGLVFPSFLSSKAEMVCSGILPIDQLRDHIPPTSLVCERIPRGVLERTYGIEIPHPGEGEDSQRSPYAHELLSAYGCMRGYMTSHGQPDEPRSARYILKDYVNGKLSYCHPPPEMDGSLFNHQHSLATPSLAVIGRDQPTTSTATPGPFDAKYFQQERSAAVTKGVVGPQVNTSTVPLSEGKPWKKHNNKNKKEKIRRTVNS